MTIVDLNRKHAWINTGSRVLKMKISRAIPLIEDDDESQITNFLKSMERFKTGPPPRVMSMKFIEDDDQRSQSDQFDRAEQEEIDELTEKEHSK